MMMRHISMDGKRHRSKANSEVQQEKPEIPMECSMCGDFGIREELFQCRSCLSRYQHTYCSHLYPNLGSQIWICNWCLHPNHRHHNQKETKWKVNSGVVEAMEGNDREGGKNEKSVNFERKLGVSKAVPESKFKVRHGPILNRWSRELEKRIHWAPKMQERIEHPNSRRGKVCRYKLLSDINC